MAISTIGTNSLSDPIAVNATGALTGTVNGYTPTASNMQPFNRIINGAMTVDQRNAGAAVTVNGGTQFGVDRFFGEEDTDGAFTLQQSTVVPVGFTNSLLATITTADTSLGSTQLAIIGHRIEGFNVADLNWGSVNAKTVTLSFWVRSSLTGTFGGALWNSAGNRSYPYSYTISTANTWEQKSITLAGDVTGTWLTNNGRGISISWSLGVGSNFQATAGVWTGGLKLAPTGATSVIGTNGATFYITGVQLEAGSTASSFAYENVGDTLQKCQRYYEQDIWRAVGVNIGGPTNSWVMSFKVPKRATPTFTAFSTVTFQGVAAGIAQLAPSGNENWVAGNANRAGTARDAYYVTTDGSGIGWSASAEL